MIQSRWTKKKKKHKIQNDLKGFSSHQRSLSPEEFSCLVYLGWFSHEGILAEVVIHRETETAVLDLFPNWKKEVLNIVKRTGVSKLSQIGTWGRLWGQQWEVGGGFKREGAYVCVWLTHVDVRQKPAQYYKASILQFKIHELIKTQSPAPLLTSSLASILFNLGLRSCLCKRGGGSTVWVKLRSHHLANEETVSR